MFLKIAGVVILFMAVAIGFLKFQIVELEKALVVAVVKQEAAETNARTAEIAQTLTEVQVKNFTAKIAVIEKERNEAQVQVNKMRNLFQDHDFAKLIAKKPGLIENLMIKKTKEVFDEIEALTTP
ncbi:MAG: hypothetical protein GY829_08595 [Gammaproteobacteria bacterium]|nr:hypothetical protein [Gammaproteobacteria bacterium]